MASYFLDEIPRDGLYEVHVAQCPNLPDKYHRLYIGEYADSRLALRKAERFRTCVSRCATCRDRNRRAQVLISYRHAS